MTNTVPDVARELYELATSRSPYHLKFYLQYLHACNWRVLFSLREQVQRRYDNDAAAAVVDADAAAVVVEQAAVWELK